VESTGGVDIVKSAGRPRNNDNQNPKDRKESTLTSHPVLIHHGPSGFFWIFLEFLQQGGHINSYRRVSSNTKVNPPSRDNAPFNHLKVTSFDSIHRPCALDIIGHIGLGPGILEQQASTFGTVPKANPREGSPVMPVFLADIDCRVRKKCLN